jgi:D-proline reductase (dithiol) PrdB
MAEFNELSLPLRLFIKAYPWHRIDPVPWAPLRKPLSECKVAIGSSGGMVMPGQTPFDENIRGGDWSTREIAGEAEVKTLIETHRSESFDHSGIAADANLALPLDRMRELVARGRIGSLNHRHLSFMGSITAPGRFLRDSVPQAANWFTGDGVDVALLVPV